jgi:hypothetical protein
MKTTPRSIIKLCLAALLPGAVVWGSNSIFERPQTPVEVKFLVAGGHTGAYTVNGIYAKGAIPMTTYPQDRTYVAWATFKNKSPDPLRVKIKVSSAVASNNNSCTTTLDPGYSTELGTRQGWKFAAGDVISVIPVNSAEYRPLLVTVSP